MKNLVVRKLYRWSRVFIIPLTILNLTLVACGREADSVEQTQDAKADTVEITPTDSVEGAVDEEFIELAETEAGLIAEIEAEEYSLICHRSDDGEETLYLPESAIQAHLDHGDVIDACIP